MNDSVVVVISLVAFLNLSAIDVLCWIKSKQHTPYFWLGWLLFAPSMAILSNILIYLNKGSIILYHLQVPFNLVWGGFMISFVKSLRHTGYRKLIFDWKLFIPALFYLPFLVIALMQPHQMEDTFRYARLNKLTVFGSLYSIIICIYAIFSNLYLLAEEYFSKKLIPVSDHKKKRIKELLWIFLALQLMAFVPFLLKLDIKYIILYLPVFGQLFFLYVFFRLTSSAHLFFEDENPFTIEPGKPARSKAVNLDSEELMIRILALMEKEKPYLNIDYKLAQLSEKLNTSVHLTSMVINSKSCCSFPDFINGYRVKAAIELLKDFKNKNSTIETIAFDCGFGNRTSFYHAFKKQTGKTPSDFVKEMIHEDNLVR
jgi:AraC-like DNA-binding protein